MPLLPLSGFPAPPGSSGTGARTRALLILLAIVLVAALLFGALTLLASPLFILVGLALVAAWVIWKFPGLPIAAPSGWFSGLRAWIALFRVLPRLGPALVSLSAALKAAATAVTTCEKALTEVKRDLGEVGNLLNEVTVKVPAADRKSLKDLINLKGVPDVDVVTGITLSDANVLAGVGSVMTAEAASLAGVIAALDGQAAILTDAAYAIGEIGKALSPGS